MCIRDSHDTVPYLEQLETIHQTVLPLGAAAADSAYDFPLAQMCIRDRSKDKRYFPVLCNVVYRFHLQIGFCRLQQNVVFFACRQSCLHISLL